MKKIRTVLGDIAPDELGVTDAHEHLIRSGGEEVNRDKDFLLDSVENAIEEMRAFLEAGGKSIVDMDPIGCGRNVPKILEVAKEFEGEGHVLLTTGFQRADFYDERTHWLVTCDVEKVAEMLVLEIEEGMDKHSYNGPITERVEAKAGVIKAGTGYGMIRDFEKKAIHAAALAHLETGAPIITHTQLGTMALETVDLFKEHGVDPENVTLSHVQKNPNPYYHEKVLQTGANICYDGPDRVKYYPDSVIAELIAGMVEKGYQEQILLSMDAGRASYQNAYVDGLALGIPYLLERFVPLLKEIGVSEEAVEDMLVNNPARILTIKE